MTKPFDAIAFLEPRVQVARIRNVPKAPAYQIIAELLTPIAGALVPPDGGLWWRP